MPNFNEFSDKINCSYRTTDKFNCKASLIAGLNTFMKHKIVRKTTLSFCLNKDILSWIVMNKCLFDGLGFFWTEIGKSSRRCQERP